MSDTDPVLPESPRPFILRIENYVNEKGFLLTQHVPVSGDADPTKQFIGHGEISMNGIRRPYRFPIDADTLERAFDLFESRARAAGEVESRRLVEEIRRHQQAIVPVPAEAAKHILGPGGQPI